MKKSKRLLAIILVIIMASSVLCVPALADGGISDLSKYNEGTGYVAIGDSITRGYGTDKWDEQGYTFDTLKTKNCRYVEGSYPYNVAKMLGQEPPMDITEDADLWVLAQDAISTTYILDLLGIDDGYCDYEYLYKDPIMAERYETMLHYFGAEDSFNIAGIGKDERYGSTGTIMSVHELIKNSSLISIDIGMGDVFNRTRALVDYRKLANGTATTEEILDIVKGVVDKFFEGYGLWLENFPVILDYLKENKKPDTPVVIVGAFNPVYNMVITDEYLIPAGNALSLITTLMNEQYKKWAEEYGFVFVDVSNVDTGAASGTVSFTEFMSGSLRAQGNATHPTMDGYQQMARMIVAELEKLEGTAQEAKTTIKVDLGSTTNVQYVLIDGHRVAYSFEDHVLTIKYGSHYGKVLTVASDDENGNVKLAVYHLSYNDGYTAYRTYVANDFFGILKTTLNSIFSIIKNAFAKFLGT